MKTRVKDAYPHFKIVPFNTTFYVADYTENSKKEILKRAVEISPSKFNDIEYLKVSNPRSLEINTVIFDNDSFTKINVLTGDKEPLSQCECIAFLNKPVENVRWFLFIELKYCHERKRNLRILKAREQLICTMNYLKQRQVIDKRQLCYLAIALPLLNSAHSSFSFSQRDIMNGKKDGYLLRLTNKIIVENYKLTLR